MKKILAALSAAVLACSMLATMVSADAGVIEGEVPDNAVAVTVYFKVDFVNTDKGIAIRENVLYIDTDEDGEGEEFPYCYAIDPDGKEYVFKNWGMLENSYNWGKSFDKDGYKSAYTFYLDLDLLEENNAEKLDFATWLWSGDVKDLSGNDGANIGIWFSLDLAKLYEGNTEVFIDVDFDKMASDDKQWDGWWWKYVVAKDAAEVTYSTEALDTTPPADEVPTGAAPVVAMAVVSMLAAAVVINKRK